MLIYFVLTIIMCSFVLYERIEYNDIMRDIKFRAWNNNDKDYTYFDLSTISIYDVQLNMVTLEEYTGLDNVYENDIVNHIIESEYLEKEDWGVITGKVIMINGQWCVGSEKYPLYGFKNIVIGNIHENTELIS